MFVTPLKSEMKPLVAGLKKRGLSLEKAQNQGQWFWQSPEKAWVLAVGGHGKTQFGLQTQFHFDYFKKVDHIICLGAAGGLQCEVLDLVCATDIFEHDYKELFTAQKPPLHKVDEKTLKHLETSGCLFGRIASGDEDIVTKERAEELIKETEATAVAWEGAGGARVAAFNNIPYTEIRGITDNARESVAQSFQTNLPLVMDKLAELLINYF